jgi:hypothetical protein
MELSLRGLASGMAVELPLPVGAGLRGVLAMTMVPLGVGRTCMPTVVGLRMGRLITLPPGMIGRLELREALTCGVARAGAVGLGATIGPLGVL